MTPGEVQLEAIAQRVTQSIRGVAAEQFGIEVVDVRWKRFNYPEAVRPSVYAEIRSERERVAIQYRAQGASQKSKIESLADLQREQLLAQARREATRVRGEGEAKAIEIYQRGPQQGSGLLRVAQDAGDVPRDPGQSDHHRAVGGQPVAETVDPRPAGLAGRTATFESQPVGCAWPGASWKYEIRSTKYETNPKPKGPKSKTRSWAGLF